MSFLYPQRDTFQSCFASPLAPAAPKRTSLAPGPTKYQARPELYGAYSTVDDVKGKAHKLSSEAAKEFEKASAAAQAKAGRIELYSGRYYAACTFGGLMACVRREEPPTPPQACC